MSSSQFAYGAAAILTAAVLWPLTRAIVDDYVNGIRPVRWPYAVIVHVGWATIMMLLAAAGGKFSDLGIVIIGLGTPPALGGQIRMLRYMQCTSPLDPIPWRPITTSLAICYCGLGICGLAFLA